MQSAFVSRRAVLLGAALALAGAPARPAAAATRVVVEDWRSQPVGATGVPSGWRAYETFGGHPHYDFTVVDDGGRRALALRSADDHSTIAHEARASDLGATPMLEWSWKVVRLPAGADLRKKATSDATGHIFVVWPRFPEMLRSRLIGYVWDPVLPVGATQPSAKTGTVTFIVVRSGAAGLGSWHDERRDVAADYLRLFGEPPPAPRAVALSIDTNDTRSPAEALFGPIAWAAR
ncbi:MAG TPA: DUF3047 domain-containing protein [Methylomirabilota bacterium]|nr:DUF3047 domain-containing protein [Methylomirabilota bacterium]